MASGPATSAEAVDRIMAQLAGGFSSGSPHAVSLAEHLQLLLHFHMDDERSHQNSDPIITADRVPGVGALAVTLESDRHFLLIVSEVG